jgi:predicted dehydrogenase
MGAMAVRLGIVDFDTSHAVEFTRRLNHKEIAPEQWVEGAQVVAGVPGRSEIAPERIGPYAEQIKALGVELLDRPQDLIGRVDGVLIESQGGDPHLGHARIFLERGIPCFVDKPFACSVKDAREMVALAQKHKVPIFSSSSLRYAPEVVDVAARREELGAVVGADASSPAALHPKNPGFFHYGIHGVETLYALMGPGCREVWCVSTEGADTIVGRWGDGRLGTVRGTRRGQHRYGFAAFCEKRVVAAEIGTGVIYRELLKQVVSMFTSGRAPLDPAVTVEIVGFIAAALRSAENHSTPARVET